MSKSFHSSRFQRETVRYPPPPGRDPRKSILLRLGHLHLMPRCHGCQERCVGGGVRGCVWSWMWLLSMDFSVPCPGFQAFIDMHRAVLRIGNVKVVLPCTGSENRGGGRPFETYEHCSPSPCLFRSVVSKCLEWFFGGKYI